MQIISCQDCKGPITAAAAPSIAVLPLHRAMLQQVANKSRAQTPTTRGVRRLPNQQLRSLKPCPARAQCTIGRYGLVDTIISTSGSLDRTQIGSPSRFGSAQDVALHHGCSAGNGIACQAIGLHGTMTPRCILEGVALGAGTRRLLMPFQNDATHLQTTSTATTLSPCRVCGDRCDILYPANFDARPRKGAQR